MINYNETRVPNLLILGERYIVKLEHFITRYISKISLIIIYHMVKEHPTQY